MRIRTRKVVLTDVLGEQFDGIGVTDNYSAYQSQFAEHQLCWAHFLRKAISVSLRNPEHGQYKRFVESLFTIYYDGVRFSHDRRLSAGRQAKASKLQSRIRMICRRYGEVLDNAACADDADRFTQTASIRSLHDRTEIPPRRGQGDRVGGG